MAAEEPSLFDFGECADRYDSWYDDPLGRMYDRLEKQAVVRLLPQPAAGDRLLEVGCGTGHWSAFFGQQGFHVVGVDISPQMIQVARGRDLAGATFEVGDAHNLPFQDSSFEVGAAIATIEFVRDPRKVLRELVRCVRPGGYVVLGVLNKLAPLNCERQRSGKPPYSAARFFSPLELQQYLAEMGDCVVRSVAFVPRRRWLLPLAPALDCLGRWLRLRTGGFLVGRLRIDNVGSADVS